MIRRFLVLPAKLAKLVDPPQHPPPLLPLPLHQWSCRIEAHVKSKNTEMVPAENASLSQQLSGALSIIHRLEKKVDRMSELMQDRTSDSNSIQLMRENMQLQDATMTQLKEENKRLRRQLVASVAQSPFSSPLPSKRPLQMQSCLQQEICYLPLQTRD